MAKKKKSNKVIAGADWEWFGHAAHFICGQWCRFHMATKVGPYLVSTVGEYIHPRHSNASEKGEQEWIAKNYPGEDIGYGRKYETMVFLAGPPCSEKSCGCGIPGIASEELDMTGHNTAGDARKGHLEMCLKWSAKEGQ